MATKTRNRWGVGQSNSAWAFNPYKPPPIPQNSFDPALDAQRRAAERGLGDLQRDVTTENTRDVADYANQRGDVVRQRDWGLGDLTQSRDRTLADAQLSGQRLDEDYQRNVGLLERSFQLLGGRQQEQANAAGVLKGGALLQAAAKRDANKAIERGALDTSYNRAKADQATAVSRFGEDFATQSGRVGTNSELALGRLADLMAPPDASNPLGGRSFQDRLTQLTRAQRENTEFGLDIEGQKAFQASGAGYVPPQPGEPGGRPKNERVDAEGNAYRTVTQGPYVLRVDSTGRVISRRRR